MVQWKLVSARRALYGKTETPLVANLKSSITHNFSIGLYDNHVRHLLLFCVVPIRIFLWFRDSLDSILHGQILSRPSLATNTQNRVRFGKFQSTNFLPFDFGFLCNHIIFCVGTISL